MKDYNVTVNGDSVIIRTESGKHVLTVMSEIAIKSSKLPNKDGDNCITCLMCKYYGDESIIDHCFGCKHACNTSPCSCERSNPVEKCESTILIR
jgi:hypothetical protein